MTAIRCNQFFRLSAVACLAIVLGLSAGDVLAQDNSLSFSRAKLVIPFGAGSFPTGRFGETDLDAEPPKSGNEAGFNVGVDLGYFVSEFLAVGVGLSYARFPLDFGEELETQFPTKKAHTSVIFGQAWARAFLPGGFERWRPYALAGVGFGRPKGTIDYEQPFIIQLPEDQGTIQVQNLESTVNTAVAVTGGLGVLVPLSGMISLMIEPRYTTVSTEGSGRTDQFTSPNGDVTEIDDTAKSNTNWWEIRGGLVFIIR